MKIKVSIVIFILLSFLNIGANSNAISYSKDPFNILEKNISSISEFEKNGVKLQYKTKDSIDKEIFRIKGCLTDQIDGSYKELGRNEFQVFNKDLNINVKLWHENKYNYVEIILLNKNSEYSTMDLKKILKNLENFKIEDVQYFLYFEGKEKELDEDCYIYKLANENNLQKTKILDIDNGYVGTGYLSNGEKINFALIKYDTGSHIIVGTPIIFETY